MNDLVDKQKRLISKLKTNWSNLLTTLQVDKRKGEVIFKSLVDAYSDRDRHYHNLQHIQHLLDLLTKVKGSCQYFSGLQLATWFHDYIYIPQAKDNELQSALYAEEVLRELNLSQSAIESVKQIIISTQKHQPLMQGIDNLIFLDVDLAILGETGDRYQKYARQIRKEYRHLSDRDYQEGRKQVLANFLSRPRIYYTDYFYQKLEQQARGNIQVELNNLK